MYCKHCGKQIDSDAQFCQYCGKQINTTRGQQPIASNNKQGVMEHLTVTVGIAGPSLVGTKYHFIMNVIHPKGRETITGPEFWAPAEANIEADGAEQYARTELNELTQFLMENGWEYAGQGVRWYSLQYKRPFTLEAYQMRAAQTQAITQENEARRRGKLGGCVLSVILLIILGVFLVALDNYEAAKQSELIQASLPTPFPTATWVSTPTYTSQEEIFHAQLSGRWRENGGKGMYDLREDGTATVKETAFINGDGTWRVISTTDIRYTIGKASMRLGVELLGDTLIIKNATGDVIGTYSREK